MKRPVRIHNLGGAQAIILHRPHPTVQALTRQLSAIGLSVTQVWPDLDASAFGADFVFFDADMGHHGQFPWVPGASPMPMIALIGSEAPGRIEWSLEAGAHAQMLKPVGDNGAYATLLVARATFDAQAVLGDEIAGLRRRLGERQTVVRAVTLLAARGQTEVEAYDRLRQMAMAWRITLEEAAGRVVAAGKDVGKDADDHRNRG
ncbi:MAG: ANTAR domain-containing response regulator [Cypionkella sp.]